MRSPVILICGVDGANDELGHSHAESACHYNILAAPTVHIKNGRDSSDEVYNSDHTSSKKGDRVAIQPNLFEDLRRIVNNGVDPCES